jgi:hypothetical protein
MLAGSDFKIAIPFATSRLCPNDWLPAQAQITLSLAVARAEQAMSRAVSQPLFTQRPEVGDLIELADGRSGRLIGIDMASGPDHTAMVMIQLPQAAECIQMEMHIAPAPALAPDVFEPPDPEPPYNFQVTRIPGGFHLSWQHPAPDDVVFRIYVAVDDSDWIPLSAISGRTFFVDDNPPLGPIQYRVDACDPSSPRGGLVVSGVIESQYSAAAILEDTIYDRFTMMFPGLTRFSVHDHLQNQKQAQEIALLLASHPATRDMLNRWVSGALGEPVW